MKRIVYQDWIVDLGRDPAGPQSDETATTGGYNHEIIEVVHRTLEKLRPEEAEFIRLYYMQGMNLRHISRQTGKPIYLLEALHRRTLKKIKPLLQEFLGGKYNVPQPDANNCPLCRHSRSKEINIMIQSRSESETWRPIVEILRDEYGINLSTVSELTGHAKYHIK